MANKIFEFEQMILEQRLNILKQDNINRSEDQNRAIDGFTPIDDKVANSQVFSDKQTLDVDVIKARKFDVELQKYKLNGTLDSVIDTTYPLEFPQVGTYIILKVDDGEEPSFEKYLLSNISDTVNPPELITMDSPLGSFFGKKKVYSGETFTLEGVGFVKYELLELGWGFPVKKVELDLNEQYQVLAKKFSIAKSNNDEAELSDVVDEICANILEADERIKQINLAYSFDADGNQDSEEDHVSDLPFSPVDYIGADRDTRIDIRAATPNNLIHYHRMADQHQRQIKRLKDLYNDCSC